MADKKFREIESQGTSVEAAIEAGLQKLGVSRDQVEIVVIDEGSRGLLGIGSREAVVRLKPASSGQAEPQPPAPKPTTPPAQQKAAVAEPALSETEVAKPSSKPAKREDSQPPKRPARAPRSADNEETLEAEREKAIEIVTELLSHLKVKATVTAHLTEPDDVTGHVLNVIDIQGEDLSVLIGPRGETLEALQYLTRLMVAHQLHRRAHFVIDVEGYRERREQALARLAERMADKAMQRGAPISLEPMSAYERRIIHMTLRDSPDVYTESAGEGKQRKVRIYPKK